MKSIAILCVNYNSYDELYNYLDSISISVRQAGSSCMTKVFIADNSTTDIRDIDQAYAGLCIKSYRTGNLGYFGGISYLMKHNDMSMYDYVIISNVDIQIQTDMLARLSTAEYDDSIAWIAPRIWSKLEGRDRNPKVSRRYSKRKLNILRTLFRYPILYFLYTHSLYKRKKIAQSAPAAKQIYAGHGSFIILTRQYIQKCGIIDYPVFLFGEEIYLAEEIMKQNLTVHYDPSLCVNDMEHASTGQMLRKSYCKYNFDALSYILRKYY